MSSDCHISTLCRMDTLKRHPRFYGYEGLYELDKIAERFEEKIYAASTSQMLPMETRSQNTMPESNSVATSVNLSDGISGYIFI
uniref:Mediator complex subunit 15 KIX domain-containing protein n=1 Tax=Lactuca sativa TaxID=4236 RepID=A0A9R1XC95_LACSA|nr:hypothetical protein LSAT_V11C500247310 [Lactuca sativa]